MAKNKKDTPRDESNERQPYIAPEPLDGGYGWVIVAAAFFIHLIVDGAAFGYGVVSKHIKEYYQVSESEATLVGSLQLGFYLLSCPFGGKMIERWGFRPVCLLGSLLSTIGFATAQLSPNIIVLMITYGVITGTGFGFMYLSSISAVTLYFDRKRVVATGIATCGSGIGMFAFSGLCNYLIEQYDWKNAILVMAGISLQGCVIGMILRPLESFDKNKKKKHFKSYKTRSGDEEITVSLLNLPDFKVALSSDSEHSPESLLLHRQKELVLMKKKLGDESGFESENSSGKGSTERDEQSSGIEKDESCNDLHEVMKSSDDKDNITHTSSDHNSSKSGIQQKDAVIKSLNNIASSMKNIDEHLTKDASKSNQQLEHTKKPAAKSKALRIASNIIDVSLLKEPIFYIICIANIFVFLGVNIPLKFQVDRALTFDISPDYSKSQEMADFLVSVSGIANTLGRATSALLDINRDVNKILVHNIAVVGCGVACFFNVFSVNYPAMCGFAAVFTFLFGIYIALSSVVVCEMLGPAAVNNAFALMCMLRGFANIAGGPLAGAAYDRLKNYDVCFYIGGFMMTVGGLFFCLLLLPNIQKRSFKHKFSEEQPDLLMITSVVNIPAIPATPQGTPRLGRVVMSGTPRASPWATPIGTPILPRASAGINRNHLTVPV